VPFFCRENVYTQFRFVNGSSGSYAFAEPHPDDAYAFYTMLFDYGVSQGMAAYENDFLNFNLLAVTSRTTHPHTHTQKKEKKKRKKKKPHGEEGKNETDCVECV
jgi:hypothetical protein